MVDILTVPIVVGISPITCQFGQNYSVFLTIFFVVFNLVFI